MDQAKRATELKQTFSKDQLRRSRLIRSGSRRLGGCQEGQSHKQGGIKGAGTLNKKKNPTN